MGEQGRKGQAGVRRGEGYSFRSTVLVPDPSTIAVATVGWVAAPQSTGLRDGHSAVGGRRGISPLGRDAGSRPDDLGFLQARAPVASELSRWCGRHGAPGARANCCARVAVRAVGVGTPDDPPQARAGVGLVPLDGGRGDHPEHPSRANPPAAGPEGAEACALRDGVPLSPVREAPGAGPGIRVRR